MRRDTYHDYITYEELQDLPLRRNRFDTDPASVLVAYRKDDLFRRSGAASVPNGVLTMIEDLSDRTYKMRVSFDSRAWTGLK